MRFKRPVRLGWKDGRDMLKFTGQALWMIKVAVSTRLEYVSEWRPRDGFARSAVRKVTRFESNSVDRLLVLLRDFWSSSLFGDRLRQ